MTKKETAEEYAILKHASWIDSGVTRSNNSIKAHFNRAMRFMNISEIETQCEILTKRIVKNTTVHA